LEESGELHDLTALPLGKKHQITAEQEAGWSQTHSGPNDDSKHVQAVA